MSCHSILSEIMQGLGNMHSKGMSSKKGNVRIMKLLNRSNCANVPQKPGTYNLFDGSGKIIYVGRSQKLRHRISSWYQKDATRPKWKRELSKKAVYFSYSLSNGKKESMKKEKVQIKKKKTIFNHYSTK